MIIIIAPHLVFPIRNGADIYVERLGCHLSKYRSPLFILGANTLTCYHKEAISSQQYFFNNFRSKPWAAVRTIIFRSHYLIEKFLTESYRKKANEFASEHPGAVFIYSLITSASLELTTKPAIIMTHNDEINIYNNHRATTKNLLQKTVAGYSEKWLTKFLLHFEKNNIFVHITEMDRDAYLKIVPRHRSVIVPAGVEFQSSITPTYQKSKAIRLLFCGALSVKMNLDALNYFKEKYWGLLKNHFNENISVWIAGSNPSYSITSICKNQGWVLYPNINNEELNSLYKQATFSILPFEYSAGAKLKLLNSLAAGLPVMATTSVKTEPDMDFPPNLFSNEPQDWLLHLLKYQGAYNIISDRIGCQEYTKKFSWQKIAEKLDFDLKAAGI